MPSDQTFEQQVQAHVGGLVRVRYDDGGASGLNGKIGLLMNASEAEHDPTLAAPRRIVLLIDGSVKKLFLYPHELEFIGADDAK